MSLLLFMAAVLATALSMAFVLKTQHVFLQAYKEKMKPDFPLTTEDVREIIMQHPNQATLIGIRITNDRIRLIWSRQPNKELYAMAKSIRRGFYRSLAILGLGVILCLILL